MAVPGDVQTQGSGRQPAQGVGVGTPLAPHQVRMPPLLSFLSTKGILFPYVPYHLTLPYCGM